jgi:coproporphyrinogen III oxidase-like Fe-S oxidoreductase
MIRPDRVARYAAQGLLVSDGRGLRLTRSGQPFVDALLREIAA